LIPKASQRGGGQDLATHLLNAFDNEYVELAEVSGAIAGDLHGAFAEWEAVAAGLTKCRNYLYSLSVNPDLGQGQLTREQYLDYVDRVEKKLGLEGQPRALVFHIKDGREHCHAVWSRIDYRSEKAIHLAFDHEKLMMVTREFAREHGLTLPDGYRRDPGNERDGKKKSLSLYEKVQERATGISKDERMVMVTAAWRQSDSPRAFVRALESMGYVLATGNRPYVLVDMYGTMNALPKMIDDRSVRTKDIRAFLEREFPPEQLPSVEEARALVAEHRKAREQFAKAQESDRALKTLEAAQGARREKLAAEQEAMRYRHREERAALAAEQLEARRALKAAYLAQVRAVKAAREEVRPTGLAAFLGRVSGVSFVLHKLHRHRDAQKFKVFASDRAGLAQTQKVAVQVLQRRHELQALDMGRQLNALGKVDVRERQALNVKTLREQRVQQRAGHDHMPALTLELKPKGRGAAVRRAKDRYRDRSGATEEAAMREAIRQEEKQYEPEIDLRQAHHEALQRDEPWKKAVDLAADFARAARDGSEDGGGDGGDGVPAPRISRAERKAEKAQARRRGRSDDFERER
jgi:Relaxase/Mobilisation nuclease domain